MGILTESAKNNLLVWGKGLLSAAIGGASTSISTIAVSPETFNLNTGIGMKNIGVVAGTGAVLAALNYLKRSPLP